MKILLTFFVVFFFSCSESSKASAQISTAFADSEPEKLLLVKAVEAKPIVKVDYKMLVSGYEKRRLAVADNWKSSPENYSAIEAELLASFSTLSDQWMGTRWALGAPQSKVPGKDNRINCGTFVGRILNDAGFRVKVNHLQRQPAQLIIQSFVGGKRVRKFSNKKMDSFLKSVNSMGPGLYIIGLDFHVGFLLHTGNDLRFIHASYENGRVRNERAADATPIITSKYRVVGKVLSQKNIKDWVKGKKIKVKGKW